MTEETQLSESFEAAKPKKKTPSEKFWAKVDKSGDCWTWTGHVNFKGYGTFYVSRSNRFMLAHRFSWVEANGTDVPDGLFVCHHCDNPPCVRPDHLYAGTRVDNAKDSIRRGRNASAKKTHCKRGHEFTPENTYITGRGNRHCKACTKLNAELSVQRRKSDMPAWILKQIDNLDPDDLARTKAFLLEKWFDEVPKSCGEIHPQFDIYHPDGHKDLGVYPLKAEITEGDPFPAKLYDSEGNLTHEGDGQSEPKPLKAETE